MASSPTFTLTPIIDTPRLTLELHSWRSDEQYQSMNECLSTPRAIQFIGLNDLITKAEIEEMFVAMQLEWKQLKGHESREGYLQQDCVYHIRPKADNPGAGKLIGFVSIVQRNDGVPPDEGWLLVDEYNGYGYATEAGRGLLNYAMDVLGIQEVIAWPKESNTGSVKVAERIGMTRTGQIRDRKTGELRAVFATAGTKWPPVDKMLMPEARSTSLQRDPV